MICREPAAALHAVQETAGVAGGVVSISTAPAGSRSLTPRPARTLKQGAGCEGSKMTNYTSGTGWRYITTRITFSPLNSDKVKNVHDVFGIDFSSFLLVNTVRSSTVSFEYFIL